MDVSEKPNDHAEAMEWINYHHLRYFWSVAKEGGLAEAAAVLHVSPPSISEQIRELEAALGEKLFRREGRRNRLTEAGQIAFGFAEEIFALGREMANAIKQRPGARILRLHVGVVDSFPKLMTNEMLRPAFALPQAVHVICREGKLEDLLGQLAAHRLDLVLSDEPAPSGARLRLFNHPLGESGTTICAEERLARKLERRFPKSLHASPALLPAENTALRQALESWFREEGLQPQVTAECEDLALLKTMAAEGRGFLALPTVAFEEAARHYGFRRIGTAAGCRVRFHAITAERRIVHPAATAITAQAKRLMGQA